MFSKGFVVHSLSLHAVFLLIFQKAKKGNTAIGLGIKILRGDYNAQSTFYNVVPNGTSEVRAVDQSIQLGDGGLGLIRCVGDL